MATLVFGSACPQQGEGEGGGEDLIAPTTRWVHHDGTAVVDEELQLPPQQLLAVCGGALLTADVEEGRPTGAVSAVNEPLGDPSTRNLGGAVFDPESWPWVPVLHTAADLDDSPGTDCVLRLQQSSSVVVVTNVDTSPDIAVNVDSHSGMGSIAATNRDGDLRDEAVLSGLNGDIYTVDWDGEVDVATTRLMPEVGDKGYCLTALAGLGTRIIAAGEVCFSQGTDGLPTGPDHLFLLADDLSVERSMATDLEQISSILVVGDELYVVGRSFEPSPDRDGRITTLITSVDLSAPLTLFVENDVRAVADLDGDGATEAAVVRQVAVGELPAGAVDIRGHEDEVIGPFVADLDNDGRPDLIYGLVNVYSEWE